MWKHSILWIFVIFHYVESSAYNDFRDFSNSWCRQRKWRVDWVSIIRPCLREFISADSVNYRRRIDRFKTSADNSDIVKFDIRPAKEFSRLFIRTRTASGLKKGFGGDAWRVTLFGPTSVAATVIDLNNGIYEALFLLAEPGKYEVEAILDYSLCDGMRDPPIDWFKNSHCSGKHKNINLSSHLYADMNTYINKPLKTKNGETFEINVPWQRWNEVEFQNNIRAADRACAVQCNVMWDGFGRWSEKKWLPFMTTTPQDYMEQRSLKRDFRHSVGHGTFWVYGDSLSYYFYLHLSDQRRIMCSQVFKNCSNTYNWIYPKKLYDLSETCDEIVLNVPKVLGFFREVTHQKYMDENSGLLLNAGAHYVKTTNFKRYQVVIQELVNELKQSYRGKPVWKTTTAIHEQTGDILGAFRRFTTNQRIILYNAYANSVMCRNKITILDVSPLTESFPGGTKDGIHYDSAVFEPVESLLEYYFSH